MRTVKLTSHEVDKVVEFMHQASGNEFSDKRALVSSKMSMLCAHLGYRHFYELWDDVTGTGFAAARARQEVIDALTTSYSYFYREDEHFARLAGLISSGELPVSGKRLRVWSAGCASGEEPYNIAMVLEDAHQGGLISNHYRVVGSDISSAAIRTAQQARYDADDIARMPLHWVKRYCKRDGTGYKVCQQLRDHVEFRRENVLEPRLSAPYDVVMCRNMMIYFDRESIDHLCSVLLSKVKPGGYLFSGHTEILGELNGFTYLEPSLWQRNADVEDNLTDSLASLL
ncbi:MAG: protein-glutamate O-methyltransferase CheR [Coriobacteriales bacterium]|nr:protein-glutamate O-methyltransferase CheR [Coriobacteriales bacterium]